MEYIVNALEYEFLLQQLAFFWEDSSEEKEEEVEDFFIEQILFVDHIRFLFSSEINELVLSYGGLAHRGTHVIWNEPRLRSEP